MRTGKGDPWPPRFYIRGFDIPKPLMVLESGTRLVTVVPRRPGSGCLWAGAVLVVSEPSWPPEWTEMCLGSCSVPSVSPPRSNSGGKNYNLHFTDVGMELSGSWDDNDKFQDLNKSGAISPKNSKSVIRHVLVFQKEMLKLFLNLVCFSDMEKTPPIVSKFSLRKKQLFPLQIIILFNIKHNQPHFEIFLFSLLKMQKAR